MRIAALISHPIQYYSPIFRRLASMYDLHVFYGQKLTPAQQGEAGFGGAFEWDLDLLSGYRFTFLRNASRRPGPDRFLGCDTPEIGRRLREGKFDALLVAGWYLRSHMQAIFAAKRLGIPVLVRGDSHLDTPRSALKRWAKDWVGPAFLRLFDAALFVGEKSRAFYRYYRYPEKRLFFSPHCVDNDWFAARSTSDARNALRARLGIGPNDKAVLFAGKLVAFKRPLDVIEAASLARSRGLANRVIVAGSGPLEAELRSRAQAANVSLHVLGFQNQSEMPAAYAAADLLVLPSSGAETWGLVVNEALACGRPVIVSDACGCAPDLAADNHVGRIYRVGDTEALSLAIAKTLASPPSAAAVLAISNRYSLSKATTGIAESVDYLGLRKVRSR